MSVLSMPDLDFSALHTCSHLIASLFQKSSTCQSHWRNGDVCNVL